MAVGRMVHLVSVPDAFHARVIAARLGSDGILTQLRGAVDGPYPHLGEVDVFVADDDLPVARQLLLADEVEAVFEERPPATRPVVPAWIVVATLVVVALTLTARAA